MAAVLLALVACGDDDVVPDASMDAAADTERGEDAGPPLDPWPARLPPASTLGERRGRALARAIVHVHSPLSHDACDGEGWVDGELADPDCLQHFRDALCALRIDVAMVTDHAPHVDEVDFETALFPQEGDEVLRHEDGAAFASRVACPGEDHRPLWTIGSENALMPLGLRRHPGGPDATPEERSALYEGRDEAAVAAMRDAGGLIWIAHTEEKPVDDLRAVALDGLELYNLHADVDPTIRGEHLGLPVDFFGDLLAFGRADLGMEPDLALLTFLSRQDVSLAKWDTLLAEGARAGGPGGETALAASGGCDAHENALGMPLADGERGDSYRRMMMWITNHLLVDEVSPDGVAEALATGRFYATHEVLGSPMGFDFRAEHAGGVAEMGGSAPLGATLRVTHPTLPEGFPSSPAPETEVVLLRAQAGGAVEVARSAEAEFTFAADVAGAYRVEVRMMPHHAGDYVAARRERLIREVVWVYSNAIVVRD